MTHVLATWNQQLFEWYTDAGGEGTNGFGANTNPETFEKNTQYRLRYLIQETAGSSEAETPQFGLEFRVDTTGGTTFGTWTSIDSDLTYFNVVSSASVTDGAATTQQLGTGTFTGGQFSFVDATALAPTGTLSATTGSDEYECEWVMSFTEAARGANFEFRVLYGNAITPDTALNTYTSTTQVLIPPPRRKLLIIQ